MIFAIAQSSQIPIKVVGIYTASLNHFIETLVYWLTSNQEIKVLLITPSISQGGEHPWCLKRIHQYSTEAKNLPVEVVDPSSQAQHMDCMYINSPGRKPLFSWQLNRWILKASKLGLLSHSDYKSLKRSLKELAYSFPYYLAAKSILFQIPTQDWHPYFFIQQQSFYSPSVHPQLIINSEYRSLVFESEIASYKVRNFKFLFVGNRNPIERRQVLQNVRQKLDEIANPIYFERYADHPQILSNRTNVLWIEYGDEGSQRGLEPPDYLSTLHQTDFCICPLGWGGNWTHRVIEAIICGAIPILEDAERYNIGLVHLDNCIAVKNNDWQTAIEQAYRLDAEKIIAMRLRLKQLKEQYLLPQKASCRLRESVGL
jgi:hypothetical protein